MITWELTIYYAVLLAFALAIRSSVLRFLTAHGVTAANYEKRIIPAAAGVLIWLTAAFGLLCLNVWVAISGDAGMQDAKTVYEHYFLALTIICCLGWTDDLIGHRQVKGLRGHLRALVKDRTVTTGLLKAAGTIVVTLWFIIELGEWRGVAYGMISLLVMTLYTNAMNLFDLRPGRAIKVFFIGCGIIATISLLTVQQSDMWVWLLPVIAGACALLPIDLRGRGMLGDTGANMLGFTLGSSIAMYWDIGWQFVALVMLVGLTLFAERYSLTAMIERVPVLNWFDQLGRHR